MGILKLQNEGDTHTMLIRKCEEVAGQYGQQVLFSDGTDTLYLPKESADRQLGRLGLDDYDAVVDMNLTFSRDPNPKKGAKPYWGIRYAGAEPVEAKPSKRIEAPRGEMSAPMSNATLDDRRGKVMTQYLALWHSVAGHLAQTAQKHGYDLDAPTIQAATATIWISWKDKGIQPDGLDAVREAAEKAPEKAPEVKMPAPSGRRIAPPSNDTPPDFSKFPPPTDDDLPF